MDFDSLLQARLLNNKLSLHGLRITRRHLEEFLSYIRGSPWASQIDLISEEGVEIVPDYTHDIFTK